MKVHFGLCKLYFKTKNQLLKLQFLQTGQIRSSSQKKEFAQNLLLCKEFFMMCHNLRHSSLCSLLYLLFRPRYFDQVGHETIYASSGNKHFFSILCHRQTYKNYEQPPQTGYTLIPIRLMYCFDT